MAVNSSQRYFWLFVNIFLGVVPSFFFFVWVAFDTHPPAYLWGYDLGLTNVKHAQSERVPNDEDYKKILWNTYIFALWGSIHSLSAQTFFRNFLIQKLGVPKEAMRTVYFVILAFSNGFLYQFWDHIDISYRLLPLSHETMQVLSPILYLITYSTTLHILYTFGIIGFTGIDLLLRTEEEEKKLESSNKAKEALQPEVITTGWFGLVRHPIYFTTVFAFATTPYLSLDRFTLLFATVLYLLIAVPFEEQKLMKLFGKQQYEDYKKKVPAVIPTLSGLQRVLSGNQADKSKRK